MTQKNSLVEDGQEKAKFLFASALCRPLAPNCSCWSCSSKKTVSHMAGITPVPMPFLHRLPPHGTQQLRGSCEELDSRSFAFHLLTSHSWPMQRSTILCRWEVLKDPKRRNEHFLMIFCLPSQQQEEVALLSPLLSPSLSIFGTYTGAHAQINLVWSKIILRWWYNS